MKFQNLISKKLLKVVFSGLLLWLPFTANSETIILPTDQNVEVVGSERIIRSHHEETLLDIARQFGVGYDEIVKSNPSLNRWVPGDGSPVFIPTKHILPNVPRQGVVLNLPELRLYYFQNVKKKGTPAIKLLHTFPVSIGRVDWKTPLGITKVVRKDKNPPWYPPESIKREHAAEGDHLPDVFPGGTPDNPLGKFALRLSVPGYLIHGTDERKAFGIGMQVTHGCVRMYPEDIAKVYNLVPVGTKVNIIDQPIKVGWSGATLFLEIHKPLFEGETNPNVTREIRGGFDRDLSDNLNSREINLKEVFNKIRRANRGLVAIDPYKIKRIVKEASGIAEPIGRYNPQELYNKYNTDKNRLRPPEVIKPKLYKEAKEKRLRRTFGNNRMIKIR